MKRLGLVFAMTTVVSWRTPKVARQRNDEKQFGGVSDAVQVIIIHPASVETNIILLNNKIRKW